MDNLFADPAARARIYGLFDAVWPSMTSRLDIAERVGARWHEVSTPFVAFEGGAPVAHVGVIEIPLAFDGEVTTVCGVHAVCAHPDHRGKGHVRRLLAEVERHATSRGLPTAQLTTGIPGIFENSGYRDVPMTRFEVSAPPSRSHRRLRRLRAEDRADAQLLSRLLATRTPVSHRVGVVEPGWLFVLNEVLCSTGFARLYAADDLDALVAYQIAECTLQILDVVARELPPLGEILARIHEPYDRIELLFTPDRFDAAVKREHREYSDHLMVRGPYPPEGSSFYLPPLAHC